MTDEEKLKAERGLKLQEHAVEGGFKALHAALILNGSACIAILGFLPVIFDRATDAAIFRELIISLTGPLVSFAFGALASVVGSTFAYVANLNYSNDLLAKEEGAWKAGQKANVAAMGLGILSMVLFACGVLAALGFYSNLTV